MAIKEAGNLNYIELAMAAKAYCVTLFAEDTLPIRSFHIYSARQFGHLINGDVCEKIF